MGIIYRLSIFFKSIILLISAIKFIFVIKNASDTPLFHIMMIYNKKYLL